GNSLDLWHLTTDHRSVPSPSPRFSLSPIEFRVARHLRAAFPELSAPTLPRALSHSNRGLLFHLILFILSSVDSKTRTRQSRTCHLYTHHAQVDPRTTRQIPVNTRSPAPACAPP